MSFVAELTSCPNHIYLALILIDILIKALCNSFLTAPLPLPQVVCHERSDLSHGACIRHNIQFMNLFQGYSHFNGICVFISKETGSTVSYHTFEENTNPAKHGDKKS